MSNIFCSLSLTEVTWSHHLLSSFTGALSASRALLQHHTADVPDAVPAMPGTMAGMAKEPQVVVETWLKIQNDNPGSPGPRMIVRASASGSLDEVFVKELCGFTGSPSIICY